MPHAMTTTQPGGWPALRRMFWYGAGLILTIAALVAIGSIVKGDFSETDGKIIGTLGSLFLAGSTALAALALVERGVLRVAARAIVAISPLCLGIVLAAIWSGAGDGTFGKLVGTSFLVLAGGLVLATNRLLVREARLLRLFAVTAAVLAVASLVTVGVIWSGDSPPDAAVKAAAAFWILTALGYFLTPIAARFTGAQPERPARVIAAVDGVELVAGRSFATGDTVVSAARGRLVVETPAGREELAEGEVLTLRESVRGSS